MYVCLFFKSGNKTIPKVSDSGAMSVKLVISLTRSNMSLKSKRLVSGSVQNTVSSPRLAFSTCLSDVTVIFINKMFAVATLKSMS